MKWSVVGLVVIGLVAATCVAILVAFLPGRKKGPAEAAPKQVRFMETAEPLKRGTVVTAEHLQTRNVPKDHLPEGAYRDPAQVIGKVLIVSMLKGQAFTKTCFPRESEGLELAGRLPAGMRAVSLAIRDSFGLRGLLYPGSTVDILVSLRSPNGGEAVSRTLLEEVQVLAVDDRTAFSPPKEKEEGQPKAEKPKQMMVTVLVDVEQAQQLQLAVRHGTLSLALRNPTDTGTVAQKPTHLGTLLGKNETKPKIVTISEISQTLKDTEPKNGADDEKVVSAPKPPRWQVTVIQGQKTEEIELPLPK